MQHLLHLLLLSMAQDLYLKEGGGTAQELTSGAFSGAATGGSLGSLAF